MNSHSYTQRNGSALVCRPLHSCGNIRRLLTHNTFSQNEEGKGTAIPGRSKEEKELERRGGGGERRNIGQRQWADLGTTPPVLVQRICKRLTRAGELERA